MSIQKDVTPYLPSWGSYSSAYLLNWRQVAGSGVSLFSWIYNHYTWCQSRKKCSGINGRINMVSISRRMEPFSPFPTSATIHYSAAKLYKYEQLLI
jgi:hypothetical protein